MARQIKVVGARTSRKVLGFETLSLDTYEISGLLSNQVPDTPLQDETAGPTRACRMAIGCVSDLYTVTASQRP